jgi:hypothetical protein
MNRNRRRSTVTRLPKEHLRFSAMDFHNSQRESFMIMNSGDKSLYRSCFNLNGNPSTR